MISTEQRNAGIDLLRILSIFFVVLLHFSEMWQTEYASETYFLQTGIKVLCFCCVDVFAMISGYVGLRSRHEFRRLIDIWLIVVLYSVFSMIFSLTLENDASLSFWMIAKAFLPVMSFKHWYFSAYFILFFFMPMINRFVESDDICNHVFACLGLTIMSTVGTLLDSAANLWSIEKGFSVFWLFMMYYVGALIKKYQPYLQRFCKKAWILYILCSILSVAVIVTLSMMQFDPKQAEIPLNYVSPLTVLSAISLVLTFQGLEISSVRVRELIQIFSATTFSVYILHYDKVIWRWLGQVVKIPDQPLSVLIVIGIAAMAFITCVAVDLLRIYLFRVTGVQKFGSWVQSVIKGAIQK